MLEGDSPAFSKIIKYTEGLVEMIVFKMIPLSADRKDIAQDIYLKAFKQVPRFQKDAAPYNIKYFNRIKEARNKLND